MIHVPAWLQLSAVALQATGLYLAGSGWRHGWTIAAAQTALWLAFTVATRQWLLLSGPAVLLPVQARNALRGGDAVSKLQRYLALIGHRNSALDGLPASLPAERR